MAVGKNIREISIQTCRSTEYVTAAVYNGTETPLRLRFRTWVYKTKHPDRRYERRGEARSRPGMPPVTHRRSLRSELLEGDGAVGGNEKGKVSSSESDDESAVGRGLRCPPGERDCHVRLRL